MATNPPKSNLNAQAKFVFRGTVKKLRAATEGLAIPDKDNLAVVRVDDIVRAPEVLHGILGKDITVRLGDDEKINKGDQATFYTNGWLFGKSVAVQSVGHESLKGKTAKAAALTASVPAQAAEAHQLQAIQDRAQTAKLVVSGRVVAIGSPAPAVALSAAASPRPKRISEHEPFWTEAVVEVEKVHKGDAGTKQVVVRFPSSTDVRWHKAPKFKVGDEGVFLLHDDTVSGENKVAASLGKAAAAVAPQGGKYTSLHEADFQPATHAAEVKAAIDAASA
jgi:hypothetical protein